MDDARGMSTARVEQICAEIGLGMPDEDVAELVRCHGPDLHQDERNRLLAHALEHDLPLTAAVLLMAGARLPAGCHVRT